MSAPNPLEKTHTSNAPKVSAKVYPIAGILTTVYGLEELPQSCAELAVLWLLHPRLQTQASMAPLAAQAITSWNSRRSGSSKGLIAVSFDQRNHGSRLVDKLANEAWRQKNHRHAQDMYSIYHGTAQDTSLLLSHLGSYLPENLPEPTQNIVLGISLGGHAAWHCLLSDPRITTGIVIIGCPDFARLMLQRAEKSRLKTFGPNFLGSSDFPQALLHELAKSDPAGLLLPPSLQTPNKASAVETTALEQHTLLPLLNSRLAGKTILNLSGGSDKLVPYACGETFLKFLKGAVDPQTGWWKHSNVVFEDKIFEGVGHEMTPKMAEVAVKFIGDVLAGEVGSSGVRSRI